MKKRGKNWGVGWGGSVLDVPRTMCVETKLKSLMLCMFWRANLSTWLRKTGLSGDRTHEPIIFTRFVAQWLCTDHYCRCATNRSIEMRVKFRVILDAVQCFRNVLCSHLAAKVGTNLPNQTR